MVHADGTQVEVLVNSSFNVTAVKARGPTRSPSPTPRGWRLVKSAEAAQIDAVIALAMAAERASTPAELPAKLLGWI